MSEMDKVAAEPCHCVPCEWCGGTSTVWFSFSGKFIGHHRLDDLDRMETCEECHGGINETCDRCVLLEEMEMDQ
jgi:hypothetical protein